MTRARNSANPFWMGFGPVFSLGGWLLVGPAVQSVHGQDIQSSPAAASVAPSNGEHHKIQVSDPVVANQLTAQGGRLIGNYGSYQLFDAPQSAGKMDAGGRAEVRDDYNFIRLNSGHLDTRKAEVKALRRNVGAFNGKRMHLVQFAGPVQPAWRKDLEEAGVEIVDYIPENTYLVYGDAPSLARVQALATAPHVQWESVYQDDFKIHRAARTVDENGNAREIGTDQFAIQLISDPDANANTLQLVEQLKLEPIKRHPDVLHYVNIVARLAPGDLKQIAARPDVISIQPYAVPQKLDERQDQIIAGNLAGNGPSGPGYLAWLASKGFTQAQFTASGFAVDVSDSGIDDGTTSPNHFGLYLGGTFSNASRVIYNRLEGTPNSGVIAGCDGHGTLNSHIIGGYDDFTNFPFADSLGFHYGLGVCPFVKLGSSVIFDPGAFTSPSYENLQSKAYHDGARVSNNSWGANVGGAYNSDSQRYDALVRDAQPAGSTFNVAGNQEMVIVFAAGNAGPGAQSVGSPGTAKNVITVGAAENVQPFGGADGSGISDLSADNINDIAFFSSRGPCSDGRHKPEIVAPGTHVSGGVFQATNDFIGFPNGIADACFDASGVSGGVAHAPFFPPGQQFYTASSGTSHSTPCVAGACALLRQYFINNFTNPPSPAMTKACLMNSARYETGVSANDTLWSDNQGMGELNLGTAFDGTPRILRDQLGADLFSASGQTRVFTGVISDTNKPFRVTLAWTDAPGSTTGNAYNNDLNLTVTVGGNTYKGNVFSGAFSVPGGVTDSKNNAECVFLPAGVAGSFVVIVSGQNINSDGVPGNPDMTDQDFALVVYNGTAAAAPVLAGAGATIAAEGCLPTNGVVDPGEAVSVNFALQNIGTSNATNLLATLLAGGGVTPTGLPQNYGSLTSGGGPVSRPFSFVASGSCGGTLTATLQLQDGPTSLGTASFVITLGKLTATTNLAQNFDSVSAPNLPAGWTTSASGAQSPWVTSTTQKDTAPNAAFASESIDVGVSELVSPSIPILSSSAQLTFRNRYSLEAAPSVGYDGGVLEIQIGGGGFLDIISAGGSFVSGGYNRTISSSYGNPLGGRQAWSGSSSGFITTTVNLPAAAAGQNIRLKWRCGTDMGVTVAGWFVDSLVLVDNSYACCAGSPDLSVTQLASTNPAIVGHNLTYAVSITNLGSSSAGGVLFTDILPGNVTFVSASPGCTNTGGTIVCAIGTLPGGGSTNVTITVSTTAGGLITNAVSVSCANPDSNSTNNSASLVTGVDALPVITVQPVSRTVLVGTNVSFDVTATGVPPPDYQWLLNGTNLPGETAGVLTLTNVQPAQAGDYTVTVTNAVGVTNSTAARLIVLVPPAISSINLSGTNILISLPSVSGLHYTLEYKTTLDDPDWLPLPPAVLGTGGVIILTDDTGPFATRFYRVRCE